MRSDVPPTITVITPAFRPRDISGYLAAHAACGGADVEWIVVDDGSGAGFDAPFDRLAARGARVIRREANAGQGAARNLGLAQASGKWVKFLDIDDSLSPGHLDALLRATQASPGTIHFAPTVHVWPSGVRRRNDSWRDLGPVPEVQLARFLQAPFLSHCGALFSRDLLMELGGYDAGLATDEDGDLLIRVLLAGHGFAAVPEAEYLYIHHEGARVSVDDDPRKLDARERVCDKVAEAFIDLREMPTEICEALAQRLDSIAMSAWDKDRERAHRLLAKARAVCPSYRFPGRLPLRIARRIGGPGLAHRASGLARRLRGRLTGGMRA